MMGGWLHQGRRHNSKYPNRKQHAISCSQPPLVFIFVFVFFLSFQLPIPQRLPNTKCLSDFSMHHIFSQECSSGTWKGRSNEIHSQVEHFFNSFPFKTCLSVSYQVSGSITDQHKSSQGTPFQETTVSHANMGLFWISSLYGSGQASLQKAQIQSHWQLHALSCPVHFVTANISGQQQRMLCHVIILCHYMGSFQILPSEVQACGVIKAFFWSACWLRVGNGTHTAALSANLREDTKGFAMHSLCCACKTCHSKTNRW